MLSISALGKGQGDYYLNLGNEDYYLEGGEPPGQWHGQGAAHLGLIGQVNKQPFQQLFMGFDADGEALVQNAGQDTRRPGWDLTFSAPKSVSVLWSQADSQTRCMIQQAHDEAVKKSLAYLEEQAETRRGKGGITRDPAQLVIATFQHGTSREQDPQLHTHALVMNVGVGMDGHTGALVSQTFYDHKMTTGALYRAELAAMLQRRLGVSPKAHKTWFELEGIDQPLLDAFSKRRQQIVEVLKSRGNFGAVAASVAAVTTRKSKGQVAREQLFQRWQTLGQSLGFKSSQVLGRSFLLAKPDATDAMGVARRALRRVMQGHSTFTERDFLRQTAEMAPVYGLDIAQIRKAVRTCLRSSQIVSLGKGHYTTRALLRVEQGMLKRAAQSKNLKACAVERSTVDDVLKDYPTMTREQRRALKHITRRQGGIQIVSGMAGTGKTYMLRAAKEAWQQSGYKVMGAALAGKAAKGLQEGAQIESTTLHRLLSQIEHKRLKLNKRTVLVVDEAGMVGTRQMAKLIHATHKSGAKLVLVGDAKQLQAIDAGGAFRKLGKELGAAGLQNITRQKQKWMKRAVYFMAQGKAKKALQSYAKRGMLTIADTGAGARAALIKDWRKGGLAHPEKHMMLAGTNRDVQHLNRKAQSLRQQKGMLGQRSVKVGDDRLHQGDRVLFTKNSSQVKNGDLGTVEKLYDLEKAMKVRLDDGQRVHMNLRNYKHVKLGYALTTHKSQGATVDHAYILAGGSMQDRELSYVQTSRARHSTRLYTDKATAGEQGKELAKTMARSRQKELAHDVLERNRVGKLLDRGKKLKPKKRQHQNSKQAYVRSQSL